MVAENINNQKFIHRCPQGHMAQWIKMLVRSSDIHTLKKSVNSILGEGSGELSEVKLTGYGNWHPLNKAPGTRTVYPGERNKGLSSTFQPPEEGWSVQRPKRYDKRGDKYKDNSAKNVHNTSSQKCRHIYIYIYIYIYNHSIAPKVIHNDLFNIINAYLIMSVRVYLLCMKFLYKKSIIFRRLVSIMMRVR